MNPSEIFLSRTRSLLRNSPVPLLFPVEPWTEEDLEEIARLVEDHIIQSDEVIVDRDPWSDWLDRYRFHRSRSRG